jgi:hypothetical protein
MRPLILAGLLLAQFVGTGLPITKNRKAPDPTAACNVNKNPTVICPSSITKDAPFAMLGGATLYGGDNLSFPGEAGCPVVRHEVWITPTGSAYNVGSLEASWNQTVLTSAALSPNPTITLTTAEWTAMGSPAVVDMWLRSYTPNDFDANGDYCVTSVDP